MMTRAWTNTPPQRHKPTGGARFGGLMIAAIFVCFVSPGLARGGKPIEEVEKKIVEKWESYRSFSAKFEMSEERTINGIRMANHGQGIFEYLKQGDLKLFRMDGKNVATREVGGETVESISSMTIVDDGEFQYSLGQSDQSPDPMAMKYDSDASQFGGSTRAMFDQLHINYTVRLLSEEVVDGHPCYVFEATPKMQGLPIAKSISYFRKDTGVMSKTVGIGPDGKTINSLRYVEVKINPKLDPSRFKFKAPQGVEVTDMTNKPAFGPQKP